MSATAKGRSVYEKREENEEDLESARILEEEEEQSAYRRELLARMFGGKLSSRQYGVLMNMTADDNEKEILSKAANHKAKNDARSTIQNTEEQIESFRRRMVLDGAWSEEKSHEKLQETLEEIQAKFPTRSSYEIAKREYKTKLEAYLNMRSSDSLMEREYYFDEGLGESLNDHVSGLTKQFPGIEIQTRRDRDGIPIVKI